MNRRDARSVAGTRYARQIQVLGKDAHDAVRGARVLVVGAGGLAGPVLGYLAAAGVAQLSIIDDDVVEQSNLSRQLLFTPADLGARKAEVAATAIARQAPDVDVCAVVERLSVHNARQAASEVDLVVDATDGMPSKYLVHDAAVLEGKPLVHGAASSRAGQVLVVAPGGRPCLRCVFPKVPGPDVVETCQTQGVIGPLVGVIGSLMAQEALLVLAGEDRAGRLHAFDVEHMTRTTRVPHDEECPVCSDGAFIDARHKRDYVPS